MVIQTKRYTVTEFETWIRQAENTDHDFEYIGGEIYEVVSDPQSSKLGARIVTFLGMYLLQNDIGHITGADGGYVVMEERYIPDAAFIRYSRQPELVSSEGYNPNPPDLAVEVVSPTDSEKKLSIKISNYLAAGTIVWVLYPDDAEIAIHRPGQSVIILTQDDTLSGGDLLPGFALPLRDVFRPQA